MNPRSWRILVNMSAKTYLVRLKDPGCATEHVRAVRFELLGEHLVFIDSDRKVAALFLRELVESWDVIAS